MASKIKNQLAEGGGQKYKFLPQESFYVMGIFELPASFHEDYMKWIRNFWWGEDENHRKVHWSSWDNLIQPKQHGGMGFRDTRLFNQALLARLTSPESSKFGSKTYEGHLLSKR